MEIHERHSWDVDTVKARALQQALAREVNTKQRITRWATVAAADISYNKRDPGLYAAVVVVDAESLAVIEQVSVKSEARFPYVPGLLSFRESPAVLEAFALLKTRPDVVLCDGQGTAHPRRMGLASHLGVWLDLPTVGCAKSWLCGEFTLPGDGRGDWSPLIDAGETIGAVVRSRPGVKPLFVSPGHRCDLQSAVAIVMSCIRTYRLPVPCRLAHQHVNELRLRGCGGAGTLLCPHVRRP
jgi:deoxyribonuclease V